MCLRLRDRGRRYFDILSHADLVKRYSQRYCGDFDVISYRDILDEIWRTAIAADLVPEVNTSTMRNAVNEPMPADWAIQADQLRERRPSEQARRQSFCRGLRVGCAVRHPVRSRLRGPRTP